MALPARQEPRPVSSEPVGRALRGRTCWDRIRFQDRTDPPSSSPRATQPAGLRAPAGCSRAGPPDVLRAAVPALTAVPPRLGRLGGRLCAGAGQWRRERCGWEGRQSQPVARSAPPEAGAEESAHRDGARACEAMSDGAQLRQRTRAHESGVGNAHLPFGQLQEGLHELREVVTRDAEWLALSRRDGGAGPRQPARLSGPRPRSEPPGAARSARREARSRAIRSAPSAGRRAPALAPSVATRGRLSGGPPGGASAEAVRRPPGTGRHGSRPARARAAQLHTVHRTLPDKR